MVPLLTPYRAYNLPFPKTGGPKYTHASDLAFAGMDLIKSSLCLVRICLRSLYRFLFRIGIGLRSCVIPSDKKSETIVDEKKFFFTFLFLPPF